MNTRKYITQKDFRCWKVLYCRRQDRLVKKKKHTFVWISVYFKIFFRIILRMSWRHGNSIFWNSVVKFLVCKNDFHMQTQHCEKLHLGYLRLTVLLMLTMERFNYDSRNLSQFAFDIDRRLTMLFNNDTKLWSNKYPINFFKENKPKLHSNH